MKKIVASLLGLVLLVTLGYFGLRYYRQHDEPALLARANAYWSAVQANDLVTAYELESSRLKGLLLPHEVGITREWGMRIVGFQLGAVTFYGDHAEVELTTEITLPDTQTGKTRKIGPHKDLWTYIEGSWYHGAPEERNSPIRRKDR